MEKILEQTLLYDFYGELLTEHQRQVYEDVVLNDFSLSEVAAARGISPPGSPRSGQTLQQDTGRV